MNGLQLETQNRSRLNINTHKEDYERRKLCLIQLHSQCHATHNHQVRNSESIVHYIYICNVYIYIHIYIVSHMSTKGQVKEQNSTGHELETQENRELENSIA